MDASRMHGPTRPIPTRRPGKSSPTGAGDKVLLPAARFGQQPAAWLLRAPMMLGFGAAAIRGKPAFSVLILLGFARFTVTGLYQAVGGGGLELTAGWLGVPLAVVAIYGGFALLLEDTSGRAVLPIGRTGAARLPGGAVGEHLDRTTEEAGVRSQL